MPIDATVAARAPSIDPASAPGLSVATDLPATVGALGVPVGAAGDVPAAVGLGRDRLAAAGFGAGAGSSLVVPSASGPTVVAVGVGDAGALAGNDAARRRGRLRPGRRRARRAGVLPGGDRGAGDGGGRRRRGRGRAAGPLPLRPAAQPPRGHGAHGADAGGARRGRRGRRRGRRRAGQGHGRRHVLARDLANSPHNHLTATRWPRWRRPWAAASGLGVEVFDKDGAGRARLRRPARRQRRQRRAARMIKLTYRPDGRADRAAGAGRQGDHVRLGRHRLKPGDAVHATMKNDMSGAGAVLAAMAALRSAGLPTAVTGYLMCTDNMPSGTALALGDVITMRGGTTVEVVNTDAEGRLVMADALVLATEEPVDAIVDIATLTGACHARARGGDRRRDGQRRPAWSTRSRRRPTATDEPVWELPLARRYRSELDSDVADIKNLGGEQRRGDHGRAVPGRVRGRRPVGAHRHRRHRPEPTRDVGLATRPGCTGFGARLLRARPDLPDPGRLKGHRHDRHVGGRERGATAPPRSPPSGGSSSGCSTASSGSATRCRTRRSSSSACACSSSCSRPCSRPVRRSVTYEVAEPPPIVAEEEDARRVDRARDRRRARGPTRAEDLRGRTRRPPRSRAC